MSKLLNTAETLISLIRERRVDEAWLEIGNKAKYLETLIRGQRLLERASCLDTAEGVELDALAGDIERHPMETDVDYRERIRSGPSPEQSFSGVCQVCKQHEAPGSVTEYSRESTSYTCGFCDHVRVWK